ncbi:Cys-Gln thioester bond-forming surface protein [Lacrimispora sp. NSJ-141]|uniref:Cys-Gln thioester bond-forming surface protein n=1 Tax=Lientehia hominis TaxID=2897778 RepID=A0AAP2W6B6_9FIRM|nr:thioester domain-containing protein [Lientehia hominis]MCD2491143.1 Cys-Gln thioester bond-forming surface protein [Lientehia hominis]
MKRKISRTILYLFMGLAAVCSVAKAVEASVSGFLKIPFEKMYLAVNDTSNVIQAYQDTSDGAVAYCLNSTLQSPDGNQSYGGAGGAGRISSEGIEAIRNIIADGYPLNTRYWLSKGIPEEAQRQATQLAVWSVLASMHEEGSDHDYFAYEKATPINLDGVDAASMYRTLAGNALYGNRIKRNLSISITGVSASWSEEEIVVSFSVFAENLDACTILAEGLEEGSEIRLDGKVLAGNSWSTETELSDRRTHSLSFPWKGNGKKQLVLQATGYAGDGNQVSVFEPSDGAYQTMGKVEKIGLAEIKYAENGIKLPEEPGKIQVEKHDGETKEPLPGVRFGVFPLNAPVDSKPICEFFTGDDGKGMSSYLADGRYEIRETEVPEGYIRTQEPKTVTVRAGQIVDSTWENLPAKGALSLKKRSSEEGDFSGDASLAGAVYEVYFLSGQEGNGEEERILMGQIVTDEAGEGVLGGLPFGDYIVTEAVPPEGYWKNPEEYEAALRYQDDATPVVEVMVAAEDEMIRRPVILKKYGDTEKELPLPHAGFSFYFKSSLERKEGKYDWEKAEPAVIGDQGETVLYTDSNGKLETVPLPYGVYLVRETDVPEGYESCDELEVQIGGESKGELVITAINEKRPEEPEEETKTSEAQSESTESSEEKTEKETVLAPASPETGDSQNGGIWFLILGSAFSVILLFVCLWANRRRG